MHDTTYCVSLAVIAILITDLDTLRPARFGVLMPFWGAQSSRSGKSERRFPIESSSELDTVTTTSEKLGKLFVAAESHGDDTCDRVSILVGRTWLRIDAIYARNYLKIYNFTQVLILAAILRATGALIPRLFDKPWNGSPGSVELSERVHINRC